MDIRDRLTYNAALPSTATEATSITRYGQSLVSPAHEASAAVGDSSSVSRTAQSVARTMSLPEVRQERIDQLRQQIGSGAYSVGSQDVADAMLRSYRG